MAESNSASGVDLKRVEFWTLGLGATAAPFVLLRWGWHACAGFAFGVFISWLNFRWLKQGVGALARAATVQAGEENVKIPKRAYVKLIARYILMLAVLCAILLGSWLPGGAILAGLFAVVAAVIVESVVRLVRSSL